MATPLSICAYLLLFTAVGAGFLFVNLLVGYFLRPHSPNAEKLEVYECGEPTIGTSFVQFDLRFYVVALLFLIFGVEIAFFFPWATVMGKSAELSATSAPLVAADEGNFDAPPHQLSTFAVTRLEELGVTHPTSPGLDEARARQLGIHDSPRTHTSVALRQTASTIKWTSLVDIAIFFGVLLMGFAYVWRRGDLDWVRFTTESSGSVELPLVAPPPRRFA